MMAQKHQRARSAPSARILAGVAAGLIALSAVIWWAAPRLPPLPAYRTAARVAQPDTNQSQLAEPGRPEVNWPAVDQQITLALLQAASAAETTATQKLEAWTAILLRRVDEDFLEWYFSYWTHQKLSVKGAWRWGLDHVIGKETPYAEHITEAIQEEFAWRVLRPEAAQHELEQIMAEVLEVYSRELHRQLLDLPEHYQIPQPEWQGYLQDIAVLTATTPGSRHTSLSLKTLTATSVGGGVMLAAALAAPLQKLGSKTSAKLMARAAGQIASRTGARVASRTGGRLVGLIIGIGIILWDLWDHEQTKEIERPKLRQAIVDYFEEIKKSLMYDPESGVMSLITSMQENILASLRSQQTNLHGGTTNY